VGLACHGVDDLSDSQHDCRGALLAEEGLEGLAAGLALVGEGGKVEGLGKKAAGRRAMLVVGVQAWGINVLLLIQMLQCLFVLVGQCTADGRRGCYSE
jgi:hypothetical protein